MEKYLRANFGYGFLATGITASSLQITLNSGHLLPVNSGVMQLVIWNSVGFPDPANDPTAEIVSASYANTLNTYNIVRAQEGTTAQIHAANAKVAMTYTAGVSNADFYFVGTKEVDETNVAASRVLQYNGTSGKLEYAALPGGGNMLTSIYDPNADGIIEDAQLGSLSVDKLVGTIQNDNMSGDKLVVSDGHIETVKVVAGGTGYVDPVVVFAYPGNHLSNKNFESWASGVSAAPTDWTLTGSGATIAQEGTIIRSSIAPSSVKLTRVGNDCYFYQRFDYAKNIAYWKGRTVTFGCWVYATSANRAMLSVNDSVSSTNSAYHTGDSLWHWLSVTRTIDSSATAVTVALHCLNGDTSVYFSGASLWDVNDGSVRATGTAVVNSGVITAITMTNNGKGYSVDMHSSEANPWPRVAIETTAGSGFTGICYVPQGLSDEKHAGDQSTFYIMRNKLVKSCGYNIYGKMSIGMTRNAWLPTNANFTDVYYADYSSVPVNPIMVFEEYYCTYVLAADGTIWACGYNNNGNLGLNDITDRSVLQRINPTYFGSSPVVKFHCTRDAGGNYTSCFAITAAGNVYRWGYNGTYILGNGGTSYLQIPTLLSGYLDTGERALDIKFGSAYNTSTAFIHTSLGQVYTAGYNAYSICSRGTSTSAITTFQKMQVSAGVPLTGIKEITTVGGAAGYGYSSIHCLMTTGGIYSAGYNANYELGNGTATNTNSATGYVTRVLGPDGVTPITGIRKVIGDVCYHASTSTVYAIMHTTGLLYGWGANSYYELSIGTNVAVHYAVPCTTFNSVIANAQQIKKVAYGRAGDLCSVVVLYSTGVMLAAGYNSYGQLGVGTETTTGGSWVLFSRRDIVDVQFICTSNSTIHSLRVLCSDGTAYCAGYQASYGQLGDATNVNRPLLCIVHF